MSTFQHNCSVWITHVKLHSWDNINLNFELELCFLLYCKIYNAFGMNCWRPNLCVNNVRRCRHRHTEFIHLHFHWSLKANKFRNSNFKWLFILWIAWWPPFYTNWPNNIQFIFHLMHIIVKSTVNRWTKT